MDILPLPASLLRWCVPDGVLEFRTTADVRPVEDVLGLTDALDALRRGVEMESPGFNVFAVGLPCAGRLTAVQQMVEALRPQSRGSRDLVYVANFREPARPWLLEFAPGRGQAFRRELLRVASLLGEEIPRLLGSGEARTRRQQRTRTAAVAHHGSLSRVKAHARRLGFLIGDLGDAEESNLTVLWVDARHGMPSEGEEEDVPVHTRAELQVLAENGAIELSEPLSAVLARFDTLERELAEALAASHEVLMETVREEAEADRDAIRLGTRRMFATLFRRWPTARVWLAELQEQVVDSPEWFEDDGDPADLVRATTANVVHSGNRRRIAPVVVVSNPTWQHLFGGIEGEPGLIDHRSIHGGSLLDADGGFLIVSAGELMQDPSTWKVLKRALQFGEVEIQNPDIPIINGTSVLRPDGVRLDVKVILLGDAETYGALFYGDPEFASVFKIKAEFEDDAAISPETLRRCTGFVSRVVRRERLSHLTRDGVYALLEWAVREAGRSGRICTDTAAITDLVREASYEAHGQLVERAHVTDALAAHRRRDDLAERRVLEMVERGAIRVEMDGARVGQVNALVVYEVGGHEFGRPIRVTATVGVGRGGVVSIERLARLSGRAHTKGVEILVGLLRERFGKTRACGFTASVCFEQSFARVDGDSAGVPEAVALVSALSGVPVRQDVAMTGSVNQLGETQAVGGVNEKIEGFYRTCELFGFTGRQGVLIPTASVPDLCLSAEVQEACSKGLFHIWRAETLDDAIALGMGVAASELDARVGVALDQYAEVARLSRRSRPTRTES